MFGFICRLFRKAPMVFSTAYQDWYAEQIARIRQGEPIAWLPGTPTIIVQRSREIDELNIKLDEKENR